MTVDERLVPAEALAPPAGSVPERVLLAWDPLVFEKALAYTRAEPSDAFAAGARVHRGTWAGAPVGVVAPGPGAAATALVADALATAGARVLVGLGRAWRVGTIEDGERVIVADEALALDAVTPRFVPDASRVTARPNVVEALATGVHEENVGVRTGAVASVDASALVTRAVARRATSGGALVLDDATAPLLAVALAHDARAGSVRVVDGALVRDEAREWSMDEGGSPLAHAWVPDADAAETERVTRAALRGTLAALLAEWIATPEGSGARPHVH